MHESAIASSLLRIVLEETAKHEADAGVAVKVTAVTVRSGVLAGVEPQTLSGCFAIMAEDTPAKDAVLQVETEPLHGRCLSCGRDVSTLTRRFECPECGAADVDWVGGNEMYIASMKAIPC